MLSSGLSKAQGLYDPRFEHDACGVGFVAHVKGHRSHALVLQGLRVLQNLLHRGATGADAATGDGAGILVQLPDRFLRREAAALGLALPPLGQYGAGLVFLPRDSSEQQAIRELIARIAAEEGQHVLGWRRVPTDTSHIGATAAAVAPAFEQVFIGAGDVGQQTGSGPAFERKLYVIRKRVEHAVENGDFPGRRAFHIVSLSSRTFIYKGMLSADQIELMYPDLVDPAFDSALALVHQRFSTNTFPSWPLAHPYRFIAHNGEINTLRGNINWMRAREAVCRSSVIGDDLVKLLPIIREGASDSATFDSVVELLVMAGRSLPHALLMMIPEPWNNHESLSPELRAFYEYHASLMEPWDGPAAIAFTDGTVIGAVLDRNGLRPARYCVTTDDLVILASEVGVLDVPPDRVVRKDRLRPGRLLLVDTGRGRIVDDAEIKHELATACPYGHWLATNQIRLRDLPVAEHTSIPRDEDLVQRLQVFGYTDEELRIVLSPMASSGQEAIGSMGNDTPLAVLSDHPRLLYDYFKQLFAQVTNPPIDAIREELVTSLESTLGPQGRLLEAEPEACRQIKIARPVLDDSELARLRHSAHPAFRSVMLPMLYPPREGGAGLERALEDLQQRATAAIRDGYTVLILSDRGVDHAHAPIPSLLAAACVHHHLVREGARTRCSLIVESGDAREVHHIALLVGYGVAAVNPYVALETVQDLIERRVITDVDLPTGIENYLGALSKGVLKVMSKMGISTIQSYRGAQIFEAIGLDASVIDRYFTGTVSRIGGIDLEVIATEAERRHARAFAARRNGGPQIDQSGDYQWRRDGEYHLFNPETVFKLQEAARTGQYETFREYSALVNNQSRRVATLRGLVELKRAPEPVPLDEVESVDRIVTRFATGAMSFGSISQEAHETLAIAMNRLGGRSNCGEGGEDPARYVREPNGDWRRSAIKQVASGRFGVTSEYLVNAIDLQIKMAQGAKPGEGGQLPGHKVYPWIARVRHATPGVGLISPPPHHDIYSIEDLAQLIYDLKNANPLARVHVKLVAEVGVGTVAAGVAKARADVVLISGHDGGTGASPLTAIKHSGAPWELGLAETQQVLLLNKLRDRIVVQVDGQMRTGRDVVVAALLGAEEFGFATAPLVVLGCVMMRVCHLNTCPVGIATQDPALRKLYAGRPEYVENFFRFVAEEVRELMAELGFRTMDEMIGRVDYLDIQPALTHWKAAGVDLSPILHSPPAADTVARRAVRAQEHHLEQGLDVQILEQCRPALENRRPVDLSLPIRNSHRTVGTRLGFEVTSRHGGQGLPDDTITLRFTGSAGQSFGAFVPRGITLVLEGDANDYPGKGLSGGKLIVFPPREARFASESNVIIGNVALYGATGGEAYVRGIGGERFAVRNSGAHAVVEGVGDHGCEYMTGGRVVVLGATGRNFAAGMSGGFAYVLDTDGQFPRRCNRELVDLDPLTDDDARFVREAIARHVRYTGSAHAARLLADWEETAARLVKVAPRDYKRALEAELHERHDARDQAVARTKVTVHG